MKPRAILFDAYGTLFDVHAVLARAAAEIDGDAHALSQLWRQKQVEHTWRRALMNRYEDFWKVTEEALQAAAAQLGIILSAQQTEHLMQAYLEPPAFPEVPPALEQMKAATLAILSNGTPAMLESAVRSNGLEHAFAKIISVDSIRTYKPKPEVYTLGVDAMGIPAGEILFVSANAWDAAGAKAFGYRVCWCNRTGAAMDVLGFAPDWTVNGLDGITSAIESRS